MTSPDGTSESNRADPTAGDDNFTADDSEQFVRDPEAAEQATRERMDAQVEQERAQGSPISSDPTEQLDGPASSPLAGASAGAGSTDYSAADASTDTGSTDFGSSDPGHDPGAVPEPDPAGDPGTDPGAPPAADPVTDPGSTPSEYPSSPDVSPSGVPAPDPGGQPVPEVAPVPGVSPDPSSVPGDPSAPLGGTADAGSPLFSADQSSADQQGVGGGSQSDSGTGSDPQG